MQIAVLSDVDATYAIQAVTTTRTLQDGVSNLMTLTTGRTVSLVYEASAGASRIAISLTRFYGVPIAYVSTTEQFPTAATAQYTIGGYGSDVLALDVDARRCGAVRCVYYITLSGFDIGTGVAALCSICATPTAWRSRPSYSGPLGAPSSHQAIKLCAALARRY
jgi:hypothetical protein